MLKIGRNLERTVLMPEPQNFKWGKDIPERSKNRALARS